MIEGVQITDLKVIGTDKGDIKHALKSSEFSFEKFGEAYFSEVHQNVIKGWKLHKEMILNLIVPCGLIKFVIFEEKTGQFMEIEIGEQNYKRLTIPSDLWVAFQGKSSTQNVLLNIGSIEHDPNESISKNLDEIEYCW
ncbi:MAG: dTDP-4-dehydrorhamnose 3,5-epimerase [Bacteriovoracaceae bacterium]|jgi:dTDP-4-dehydrorhamnose 3,5-epimerase|nr:dTDP-4-dehydrorhamnose 3,5-epimerase [Bacteriovoracaceae bacterium]